MKIKDEIIKDYESLHGLAEVGFDLPRTIEYVKSRLCDMSIEHEELGGGIVGYIGQRRDGCTLLRADMDALPIKEKTGLPFSAEGDAMQPNMYLQREIRLYDPHPLHRIEGDQGAGKGRILLI